MEAVRNVQILNVFFSFYLFWFGGPDLAVLRGFSGSMNRVAP